MLLELEVTQVSLLKSAPKVKIQFYSLNHSLVALKITSDFIIITILLWQWKYAEWSKSPITLVYDSTAGLVCSSEKPIKFIWYSPFITTCNRTTVDL